MSIKIQETSNNAASFSHFGTLVLSWLCQATASIRYFPPLLLRSLMQHLNNITNCFHRLNLFHIHLY
jgi:hypothetical protein